MQVQRIRILNKTCSLKKILNQNFCGAPPVRQKTLMFEKELKSISRHFLKKYFFSGTRNLNPPLIETSESEDTENGGRIQRPRSSLMVIFHAII